MLRVLVKNNCDELMDIYVLTTRGVKLLQSSSNVNIFENNYNFLNYYIKSKKNILSVKIPDILYGIILKELFESYFYRRALLIKYKYVLKTSYIIFCLEKSKYPLDYSWGYKINNYIVEYQHLSTAMSWLSTLGGAFSSLGDFEISFANKASEISLKQIKIAFHIGDPFLISRCRLYCAIALIQQEKYKYAAKIIKGEYNWVKNLPEQQSDRLLMNMCLGIWTKLKYEHSIHRLKK